MTFKHCKSCTCAAPVGQRFFGWGTCPQCERSFVKQTAEHKYCSQDCRYARDMDKLKAKLEAQGIPWAGERKGK